MLLESPSEGGDGGGGSYNIINFTGEQAACFCGAADSLGRACGKDRVLRGYDKFEDNVLVSSVCTLSVPSAVKCRGCRCSSWSEDGPRGNHL